MCFISQGGKYIHISWMYIQTMTLNEVASCQLKKKSSSDPFHSQDYKVTESTNIIPYSTHTHTQSQFLLLNSLMSINENHTETQIVFIKELEPLSSFFFFIIKT